MSNAIRFSDVTSVSVACLVSLSDYDNFAARIYHDFGDCVIPVKPEPNREVKSVWDQIISYCKNYAKVDPVHVVIYPVR